MTEQTAEKLTREQFARMLRHGRGAALLYAQEHGIADVEDLVIEACVEKQAYDEQCEPHRAAWMYRFFKDTPAYPRLSAALLAQLAFKPDNPCSEQLCELVALMAIDGDAAAAAALRRYVWSQDTDGECLSGARAIALLDGVPALVEVARRHGKILLADPDDYVEGLSYLLDEDTPAHAAALAELERLAGSDAAVEAFLSQHQRYVNRDAQDESLTAEERADRREAYFKEQAGKVNVEQLLRTAADEAHRSSFAYRHFGQYASADDIDQILRHLSFETRLAVSKNLLRIFQWAILPRMHPRIWELAHDGDPGVRNLAFQALAHLTDPVVGELGRARLRAADLSPDEAHVLQLLTKQLQPGDEALILSALQRLELDAEQLHAFGMAMRDVLDANDAPALALWLYDTNPCAICREYAVEALLDAKAMPKAVAEECRQDACDEIRALVSAPAG